jgi:hypothetical protein
MICLLYYVYVFSATKLEIRAEQVLPESEGRRGEKVGEGTGGGRRKDPNNVRTCE